MERQEIQLVGGGNLSFWEEGGMVRLQAVRPDDRNGLYKVWVRGRNGSFLLGTLAPESGALGLRRQISRGELERSGCWPITGGEAKLVFSFAQEGWKRQLDPDRLVKDTVLRRALFGKQVLLRQDEKGFCLAAHFEPGQPFPLEALFCLSKIQMVEGKRCAVFFFDRDGEVRGI